jgi:hypothetical protein
MWKWLEDKVAALVALSCVLFETAPENMDDGRSGNLPPPQGAYPRSANLRAAQKGYGPS